MKNSALCTSWSTFLQKPVDGAGLAVFRMLFGGLMFTDMCFYVISGRIGSKFIEPTFLFSFLPFVQRWPGEGMYLHFVVMAMAALLIAVGLYYRAAAITFAFGITYVFMLDKAQYLNHIYLICLISFLMTIVPAHRVWSLDNKLHPHPDGPFVPFWSVLLLRTQLCIVYFYGGLSKLNPDWLAGEPQSTWMWQKRNIPLVGPIIASPGFVSLVTYGGIAIDLLIPFMLCWRRTFALAAIVSISFHLMNSFLFRIGVFPWFMICTLVLFPAPDWPRRFFKRWTTAKASAMPATCQTSPVLLIAIQVYLVCQLLIPFRHHLYPGEVDWTEEGYYFSWRMMLHHKDVTFEMHETDPRTGKRERVDLRRYLTNRQIRTMRSSPELIQQFALWLADREQARTGVRPIITARAFASLNRHQWQDMIETNVDLASQPMSLAPQTWILPLHSR